MKKNKVLFTSPEPGFEDFDPKSEAFKVKFHSKSQASQTFFRVNNPQKLRDSGGHFRATTTGGTVRETKESEVVGVRKELIEWNLGKSPSSTEEEKMKNIEQLTKIKRKCNEFLESGDRIMSSVMVSHLMKGIKILSNFAFEYKELFALFPVMFQNALYLNPELISEYEGLIKGMENERIKNYVKINRINKCPYTVFCGSLLEEHRSRIQALNGRIRELEVKIQEMSESRGRNEETIRVLQELIARLREDEKRSPQSTKLQQMQLELNKLETENVELKSSNEVLRMKYAAQESDLIEYRMKSDYLQSTQASLEEKIDNLTGEKEKIIRDYENRINSFRHFKQQAADLKNTLDKIIIKMASVKVHFQRSHQEKSDLLQERNNLVVRAAAGFENLTPRPNCQQLASDKNLSLGTLLPKSEKKKKMTTVCVVDNLLNKICEYQAKIAFMDTELKERRKMGSIPQGSIQANGIRKPSVTNGQKTSINQRILGSISPNKASKMVNLDLEKKSRFINVQAEDDSKSNTESPPKTMNYFDFKEEITNTEMNTQREKEDVRETEEILQDIIESKKMIEQFEAGK